MTGPWEKYKAAPVEPSRVGTIAGPWEKYKSTTAADNAPESSPLEKATTGARSYLEGQTLGITEPLVGSVNAVIGNLIQSGFDAKDASDYVRKILDPERIKKEYELDVAERRRMKAENQGIDTAGQLAGAIAPALMSGGEALLVNTGRMAPTAARTAQVAKAVDIGGTVANTAARLVPGAERISAISNPIVKGAATIARSGAQGAAVAGLSEVARQGVLESTGYMKDGEGPSIRDAMSTGAGWSAALAAVPQGLRLAKWGSKKTLSTIFGPKEEVIDKYLQNADRINNARTEDDLKMELNRLGKQLEDDVASKRISKQEADGVVASVQDNIKQIRTEATQEFQRQKYDASRAVDDAKSRFNDQVKGREAALRGVRAPLEISGDVETAKRQLKDMVVKSSKEAVETLPDNMKVNLSDVYKGLRGVRDSLDIANVGPATPQAARSQAEIDNLMNTLGKLPAQVTGRDAKRVIQQVDRAERVIYSSGEFTDEVGQAFKTLRSGLDQALKTHQPYKSKMEEVAQLTGLLDRVNQRFPDQRATQSKLSGIYRPQARLDREDLAALASATGQGFLGDVDNYVNAQQLLANRQKLESLAKGSPEYVDLQAKIARLERMQNPDAARNFVSGAVDVSGLNSDLVTAQQKAADAESKLQGSIQRKDEVGIGELSGESLVNQLMRERRPLNARNTVGRVDKEFGKNIAQEIDDRRVLDSFEKGNTNGSRNVNLLTIAGHTVGIGTGALGGTGAGFAMGGPLGAAAGALTGALVDKYGPQMAKGILDAVLKIQGYPSVQKIQSLNLPQDVKNYLANQFIRHEASLGGMATESVPRAAQKELDTDSSRSSNSPEREPQSELEKPKKGRDKWIDDGLKNLEKHGMNPSQFKDEVLRSRKGQSLLISASDLKPGSKAMERIREQIMTEFGKGKK